MLFGNVAHLPLKEDFAAAREMGTNCKLPHSYKWNQMAREIPFDFGYISILGRYGKCGTAHLTKYIEAHYIMPLCFRFWNVIYQKESDKMQKEKCFLKWKEKPTFLSLPFWLKMSKKSAQKSNWKRNVLRKRLEKKFFNKYLFYFL